MEGPPVVETTCESDTMPHDYKSLLAAFQRDPRYLRNLSWGQVRSGHPEGTVQAHIEQLDRNLTALESTLTREEVHKLRLLIHTHDTFKAEALRGVAIEHPQSHASLARAFLAEFIDDSNLLAMVQFHDEPFALWKQSKQGKTGEDRLERLLARIHDWDTFLAFQIIDNVAPGKERTPLFSFFERIAGHVASRITADDARRLPLA